MKFKATILCSLVIAVATPDVARAQSEKDFAAWFAMMLTPVGSLPPMVIVPTMKAGVRAPTFAGRLGRWAFPGDNLTNYTFGATMVAPVATKALLSGTLAYMKPGCAAGDTCDGTLMLGADIEAPFAESMSTQATGKTILSASLKGSLGYGRFLGSGGGNAISLVGFVPLSVRYVMASNSTLSAFLSPGFGIGNVSDSGNSEQGTRPLLGGGAAWSSATGVGIHLSAQKVFIDGGPTMWGLSFSFVP